jgi:hypothetical protein
MTCNLAVSIAKAGISNEQLLALLTPANVEPVLLTYLRQQYPQEQSRSYTYMPDQLQILLGDCAITIVQGQIEVTSYATSQDRANRLAKEIEGVLAALADALFQQQIQETLRTLGIEPQVETVTVENEGKMQQAAVFTLTF